MRTRQNLKTGSQSTPYLYRFVPKAQTDSTLAIFAPMSPWLPAPFLSFTCYELRKLPDTLQGFKKWSLSPAWEIQGIEPETFSGKADAQLSEIWSFTGSSEVWVFSCMGLGILDPSNRGQSSGKHTCPPYMCDIRCVAGGHGLLKTASWVQWGDLQSRVSSTGQRFSIPDVTEQSYQVWEGRIEGGKSPQFQVW